MQPIVRLQARPAEPRAHPHRRETLRMPRMPQAIHPRPPPQNPHAAAHGRTALPLRTLRPPVRAGRQLEEAPPRPHRRTALLLRALHRQILRLQSAESPHADPHERETVLVRPMPQPVQAAAPPSAPQVRRAGEGDEPGVGRDRGGPEVQAGAPSAVHSADHAPVARGSARTNRAGGFVDEHGDALAQQRGRFADVAESQLARGRVRAPGSGAVPSATTCSRSLLVIVDVYRFTGMLNQSIPI